MKETTFSYRIWSFHSD